MTHDSQAWFIEQPGYYSVGVGILSRADMAVEPFRLYVVVKSQSLRGAGMNRC